MSAIQAGQLDVPIVEECGRLVHGAEELSLDPILQVLSRNKDGKISKIFRDISPENLGQEIILSLQNLK